MVACGTCSVDVGDGVCVTCEINRRLREFYPREPRWRYWTGPNGWLYGWTTEKMGDGKYGAVLFKPVGRGARSGKATSWEKVKEVHFATRTKAKARAAQWFNRDNKPT